MKFEVLTLFPELITSHLDFSIMKRAKDSGIFEVNTINPRDFTLDKHKKVDDTPYGGGAGMVLMPQPYINAYESIKRLPNNLTLMMTPQGEPFCDELSNEFSKYEQIIILCGHYEGFDERIKTRVDEVISIGDYILTGGEIPSMAITDSIARLIPGVIRSKSLEDESFNSSFLDYPTYTKPSVYRGLEVPKVLLSGNHKNIEEYRNISRIEKTKILRPDLMEEDHE